MKTKLVVVLLTILTVSCKKEESKTEEKPSEVLKTFNVKLNMIVPENDNFQIFYTEFETEGFDEKKSLWMPVTGKDEPQIITFKLPQDVLPTNLRIDLGNNENQKPMKFNSFKMEYYGKSFELKDTLILKNFIIGDQLIFDKQSSTLTPKKGDNEIYDPLLYPQDNLKVEIMNIVK